MTDGTGIVHIAPGFGEDDATLGKENNLSILKKNEEERRKIYKNLLRKAYLEKKKKEMEELERLKGD
jgi:isoleucyl-tRNA synthetase